MSEKHKIQTRSLSFSGHDGSQLVASLDFPRDIAPTRYAIMCHCFTCTRQTLTTSRLCRGLAQAGVAVLRFDFTGLGESEGSFADSHFSSMIGDIECAAEFLHKHYQAPDYLLGHSMGGTACLAASQNGSIALARVSRLVTIASPASPEHVLHHFGPAMKDLQQGEASEILVAGQAYPVKPSFISDVEGYDMVLQMQNCHLPVLAVSAGNDELVGAEAARQILQYTQGERKLLEIDQADHLISDRGHSAQMISVVSDWLAS